MIDKNETFKGTWPFAPKFSVAAGFQQHFINVGQRDGEVLLCLYGEPTWGYIFRKMIPDFFEVVKNGKLVLKMHL